jgi:flagellar basal-body rod modification protein FlgD
MIIGASQQSAAIQPAKSDSDKAGLNYDAFLKLMLAQLKSQDPLNPVDQTESLAQLATFTNVEQAIKLNQKLDALLVKTSATEATSLLGKTVQAIDGSAAGTVKAVETSSGGTFALLADGRRLNIADGIRISTP